MRPKEKDLLFDTVYDMAVEAVRDEDLVEASTVNAWRLANGNIVLTSERPQWHYLVARTGADRPLHALLTAALRDRDELGLRLESAR